MEVSRFKRNLARFAFEGLTSATSTETPGNAAGMESEMGQKMVSETPLGRLGCVEDIAKVAVFLASPESAWITGETIRVSGGLL